MNVIAIVEGDGEVAAFPVLLRRIAAWRTPQRAVNIPHPIRIRRDRFINRHDEFNRYLQLAAAKCGDDGRIFLLLDADDDCPATTGRTLHDRARNLIGEIPISVVLANREYEAWFIAAAESLHGCRGFRFDPTDRVDAETPRDAKGWIRARMADRGYGETTDQPALSASMDLQQAFERSRSFRKLCAEWDRD